MSEFQPIGAASAQTDLVRSPITIPLLPRMFEEEIAYWPDEQVTNDNPLFPLSIAPIEILKSAVDHMRTYPFSEPQTLDANQLLALRVMSASLAMTRLLRFLQESTVNSEGTCPTETRCVIGGIGLTHLDTILRYDSGEVIIPRKKMPTSLRGNSSWYYNDSLGLYVHARELGTESEMGIDLLRLISETDTTDPVQLLPYLGLQHTLASNTEA
ncbi:MAG: hypothetical protein WAW63_05985 [Candidatus Saccharimonadales bacterium]